MLALDTLSSSQFFAALEATWPAAETVEAAGWRVRRGQGGGSRVSAASLSVPFGETTLEAAEALHAGFGQMPLFMVRAGEDVLDAALAQRGYRMFDPVLALAAPLSVLTAPFAAKAASAHWPPLAITCELWQTSHIGAARQQIMARVTGPKAAVLGHDIPHDKAAGAGFAAIAPGVAQGVCMLHALATLPAYRRAGLGRAMTLEAARWAQNDTAAPPRWFALAVTEANTAARALYEGLGLTICTRYHYRVKDSV